MLRANMGCMRIRINHEWLLFQGTEKLVHDGQHVFQLDSKDHVWVFPHLVPMGLPLRSANYRAYLDYISKCVTIELFGPFLAKPGWILKNTRRFFVSDDGVEMKCCTEFHLLHPETKSVEYIARIDNPYLRVWRDEQTEPFLPPTNTTTTVV